MKRATKPWTWVDWVEGVLTTALMFVSIEGISCQRRCTPQAAMTIERNVTTRGHRHGATVRTAHMYAWYACILILQEEVSTGGAGDYLSSWGKPPIFWRKVLQRQKIKPNRQWLERWMQNYKQNHHMMYINHIWTLSGVEVPSKHLGSKHERLLSMLCL